MKKAFVLLLSAAALCLVSCGGAKSDAKKLAKQACKCQAMEESENPDEATLRECWSSTMNFAEELYDKYKDNDDDLKIFEEVMDQAEKDCVGKNK